eukprot:scaffold1384_cov256-Pinguiococcus_pyrenoidosus.AAC.15
MNPCVLQVAASATPVLALETGKGLAGVAKEVSAEVGKDLNTWAKSTVEESKTKVQMKLKSMGDEVEERRKRREEKREQEREERKVALRELAQRRQQQIEEEKARQDAAEKEVESILMRIQERAEKELAETPEQELNGASSFELDTERRQALDLEVKKFAQEARERAMRQAESASASDSS